MTHLPSPTAMVVPTSAAVACRRAAAVVPGVALCGAVTAAAFGAEAVEAQLFGRAALG